MDLYKPVLEQKLTGWLGFWKDESWEISDKEVAGEGIWRDLIK